VDSSIIELNLTDLPAILGTIAMAIVLSKWQELRLEGQLLFAAGRSLLQLMVVGYILAFVFDLKNPVLVLSILLAMLTIAARVSGNRIGKKIKGIFPTVWLSLFVSSALTLSYTIALIIQPNTWYEPQYLIPLLGMVLGNAMNAASVAGERLVNAIDRNHLEVETHLCLGATPKQAIETYRIEAIRAGLIPTLNQMTVVGLVSLPGMFTGQVLAGVDPLDAAAYQILILFAIALANTIATVLVTEGVYRQFFNANSQLIGN
jgi:putative ABC transport system permease protein